MMTTTMTSGSELQLSGTWTTLAISLIGMSHIRSSRPNQDSAMAWTVGSGVPELAGAVASQPVPTDISDAIAVMSHVDELQGMPILTLSDGHGGKAYDRSNVGSALAVKLAALAIGSTARSVIAEYPSSSAWVTELPRRLVQQWRKAVMEEGNTDSESAGQGSHITRYGATVLGAVVGDDAGLFFQLGDGDMVVVDTGLNVHHPTPAVIEMFGSETESLCQKDAEFSVRVQRKVLPADEILMVMLSSDGISNSFIDDDGFDEFVRDIAETSTRMVPDVFRTYLFKWIASCTSFSADDVSMAIAVRHSVEPMSGRETLES